MAIVVDATSTLLFIGDSITDSARRLDPDGLGYGYVRLLHAFFTARDATAVPTVINRGVNAHCMPDLQARWQSDVLDLRPDVVSICIGVNDAQQEVATASVAALPTFVVGYQDILRRTRTALPHAALVLCEPPMLQLPGHPDSNRALQPYVEAVHHLAAGFDAAAVVGLYHAFEWAHTTRPEVAWSMDGLHPTACGHQLIGNTWLTATGLVTA